MTDPRPPYFVVSCARSGSTSLARILDTAVNGRCAIEPMPNLNRETRDMMDGRIPDPAALLERTVIARVREARQEVEVYGEKNVTYGPFIPWLARSLDCRFVFLRRDGRDVVRSLMDWHELMFGTIYRECREPGRLSPHAVSSATNLPVEEDSSDYARPRPRPGEPLYEAWENLTREEMCAYYWSRINHLYRGELTRLPSGQWVDLDYTRPRSEDILQVAEFLGLRGLERGAVDSLLAAKINSLEDRLQTQRRYPHWTDWDSGQRDRFERLAGEEMEAQRYFSSEATRWRPEGYGLWWERHEGGLDWYEWMYASRRAVHEDLVSWVAAHPEVESVADFGAGFAVGYAEHFHDKRFVGIDLVEKNTAWCRENRTHPQHDYWSLDFVAEPLPERFDLVFSSGTIDNAYDVDACLAAMVRASRAWIHVTAYRGWFPERDEHGYRYDPNHACFYTDVSPSRIQRTLQSLGCRDIQIGPVATGGSEIPYETRIIARVPAEA